MPNNIFSEIIEELVGAMEVDATSVSAEELVDRMPDRAGLGERTIEEEMLSQIRNHYRRSGTRMDVIYDGHLARTKTEKYYEKEKVEEKFIKEY